MYEGMEYATGDFILIADTVHGEKEIYRWSNYVGNRRDLI
jgi:hypothetical protein